MHVLADTINYTWYFEWPKLHSEVTHSPSGHTIQYLLCGNYTLGIDHKRIKISEGDVVYYSGFEEHSYSGSETAVSMFSINFTSSFLSDNRPEQRTYRGFNQLENEFRMVHEGFNSESTLYANINAFKSLFTIIGELFPEKSIPVKRAEKRWNEIENYIKTKKEFRLRSSELGSIFGMSQSTLYRACREAKGLSPERRLRVLRMNEAVKLLKHTNMNVSEIAFFLKYKRLHDFSREFSQYFKKSPTEFLKILRKN